nr:unnamed protein product [Callosobruchus analis]
MEKTARLRSFQRIHALQRANRTVTRYL